MRGMMLSLGLILILISSCGGEEDPIDSSGVNQIEQASKCLPSCTGKSCGSDGYGGSCGNCATGQSCSVAGVYAHLRLVRGGV